MKKLSIALLYCIIVIPAAAQGSYTITGLVRDENKLPVPFANAALFTTDSTLVTGAVSDGEGRFTIATRPGSFLLKISFLSFEDKFLKVTIADRNVDVGTISLNPSSQMLEAVTVEGEKSQMELYLDKRVFQVGKDLSNISGSATDILDNVPSVTVDVEGNISLRGSQNVRVLIDGKPSGLAGISTADALRQLQGNLIESVEVITNPSARFDAEGEVGIINIILKKEKNKGVNGSFAVNTGYPASHGASFNLNFRREKLNFFSSYGFSYRASPGRGGSYQSFNDEVNDTAFYFNQFNKRTRSGRSHNLRAGVDYFFNDKNTLTGSFLLRRSAGLNTSLNEYQDFDVNGSLANLVRRFEREEEPEFNSEIALSYRRTYDRKGRLLTADFKWIENVETEFSNFEEQYLTRDSTGFQRAENTEDERNALLQIDYTHPFGEKGKIETGFKSTLRVIDNDFTVEEIDPEDNSWRIRDNLDNNLIYTENIHAGYFIIGNELRRFSWQGGLRGELSDIAVELVREKEKTYQFYFNLFPSVHLSYRIAPEKTVQLSYSYRISRPRYRDLMPFSNISDIRSVPVGNPFLRPEFTNSIEAGYLLNWNSGSMLSSVYYRYRTGVVERITEVDSAGFTSRFPVNLGIENAYGVELNFSYNPTGWLRVNSNTNLFRAITEGFYQDRLFFSDTYTWTNRTTMRFTLRKNWDVQAGLNYRAPRITPQGKDFGLYSVDAGLSRDILKGKGTLTASVRDVFNSRKFRSITERPDIGYYAESEFQWRPRQLILTFTYRLNSKKETRSGGNGEQDDGGDEF